MTSRAPSAGSQFQHALWITGLVGIVVAYLGVGLLYALNTPAWQAPDEPAHYNYIRQVAKGEWPVIEPADYDERYRNEIVSSRFAPQYRIEPLTYEDWQPPLYYLLLTPIYLLFDGALVPLRATSLLLGSGTIVAAYAVARRLWPAKPWLALTAVAFVAFLPQHIAILSSVNNDSLSWLLVALILWLLSTVFVDVPVEEVERAKTWIILGLLLGLGFITKLTVYIMAPVIFVALLFLYWNQRAALARAVLLVFVPATLLGAVWWARNLLVYEGFDPLAMAAHDSVVVGQQRTQEWLATLGVAETLERFAVTSFRSFWGQFGWMGVLMDSRLYLLLFIFSLAVLLGLLLRLATVSPGRPLRPVVRDRSKSRAFSWILVLTLLLNAGLYVGYNVTFVQHQARYLFAALIPISLAVAIAIEGWVRPLINRWGWVTGLVPILFSLALVGLDLLALYQFIVPQLTAP